MNELGLNQAQITKWVNYFYETVYQKLDLTRNSKKNVNKKRNVVISYFRSQGIARNWKAGMDMTQQFMIIDALNTRHRFIPSADRYFKNL